MLGNTMPDFDDHDTHYYNKEFSYRELTTAIYRSGSNSVGPDKVHYEFFRHMDEVNLRELLKFFNFLWTNDQFPQSWAHSYIIPILKPGKDCNKVDAYRPIQLTSVVCKIMERMIGKRLGWCLEQFNLVSKYQCAFRENRSTMDQLVRLESHIRDGFTHHSSTLGVLLDIKSAYNTVSPNLLMHRLYSLGFRGHMMYFLRSYLSNRTFQVRCGALSDTFSQDIGLVQGGVLSPLLFNVAINSMLDSIPSGVSYALYADDVTIWTQGRQIAGLFAGIQQALNGVGDWARNNGFLFSAEKSNAVLFRRSLRRVDVGTFPTLVINDAPIQFADRVRYLGVWLDSKLSLSTHVHYTRARALQRMALLKCVSGKDFGADRTVLIRMYKSLIRPILDYAAVILDGSGSRVVQSLECVQNTALRIATGALRTCPVQSLHTETHIVPLSIRRKELTLRYLMKVKGDIRHPCRNIVAIDDNRHVTRGLSEKYLKRVSGFPLHHRLLGICRDMRFQIPPDTLSPRGLTPPWLLPDVSWHMLLRDKRNVSEMDVREAFQEHIAKYPDFRRFYTDGSKMDGSTGCAYTVNNAFFAHRLDSRLSVYTAELVAIREALQYVMNHRVEKAMICSDSKSAILAIPAHHRTHGVLIEISELLYRLACNNCVCHFIWIPGHCGIAGNVLADHGARLSHRKDTILKVNVGHREFTPMIRQCTSSYFARLWQAYRPTFLKTVKPDTGYWESVVRSDRREEKVLCRLRTGHTLLTHRYILDRDRPPLCDTCHSELDVTHFLIVCPKYRRERQQLATACLLHGVRMDVRSLLGDETPALLDAVFRYLKDCRLFAKL